jgi:hypothetical protein
MKRVHQAALGALLIALWLAAASSGEAMEFVIVGPRATGMGGAGVAVTTDSLATYWNPAGMAMSRTLDIRVQASGQATDRLGFGQAIKGISDTNLNDTSAANQSQLQGYVSQLNQPGANLSAAGAGGLYFKGFYGHHAFGMNVSDVATGGSFVPTPITVTNTGSNLNVNGQLALQAFEQRQVVFSYAYAFADRTFSLGGSLKIIQGASYLGQIPVTQAFDYSNVKDALGKATLSTAVSLDVGAIYRPAPWIRFGIVGKNLTQPTFDTPDGGEVKLTPQVRGGIAINPTHSLTITFDGDITSNPTLLPGVRSQVLSLGAEQVILSNFISLQAGVFKNVQDATSTFVPTAGLGLRIYALRVEIAGGYDFRESQALASASVAMTF